MAGDPEKAEAESHRASSRDGDSTDEHESTRKHETAGDTTQVPSPSSDPATLAKFDSGVKVNVKDEDIYAHLPPAEAEILKRQINIPIVKDTLALRRVVKT